MHILEAIALVWLVVLSLSIVALYGAVQTKWVALRSRLDNLQLAEHMHRVTERLDSNTVRQNAQLRAALEQAVQHIESHAHLMDKYWHELRAIKELLK